MATDWLLDASRDRAARDRLMAVAAELIAEAGIDRFDVTELARRAHCSRATVYRHVGGRNAIVEEVLRRASGSIVAAVDHHVRGLTGRHRAVTALTVALAAARHDRIASQYLPAVGRTAEFHALMESTTVITTATDLIGLSSPDSGRAQLAVRVFLTLLLWPPGAGEERQIDLLADLVSGTTPGGLTGP